MPQEVSVSYQAIKSKVYRLIDALVVGEKSEAEVQESIRRWWDLIHPADRPVAQKYLLAVLEHSYLAVDAIEEGLMDATEQGALRSSESPKTMRLVSRMVKQAARQTSISTTACAAASFITSIQSPATFARSRITSFVRRGIPKRHRFYISAIACFPQPSYSELHPWVNPSGVTNEIFLPAVAD